MAETKPAPPPASEARTLDTVAADRLIDGFLRTVEKYTYRVTDLPKQGPILEMLALDPSDLRLLVSRVAHRILAIRQKQVPYHLKPGVSVGEAPWMKEHGLTLSLLTAKILSRRVDLGPEELAALVNGAYDSTHAYCIYEAGLFKAIEQAVAAGPVPPDLLAALESYLAALRRGYTRENAAAAIRLDKILRPGAAVVAVVRAASPAEEMILRRAAFECRTPSLADAFIAVMTLPADENQRRAVSFGEVSFSPAIPSRIIDEINALLSGSASNYRDHHQGDCRSALEESGVVGAKAMTAAAAAMASKPIRYDFDSQLAQRFHNGCHNLLTFTLKALKGVREADADDLLHVCHSLSRFRPPEYVYIQWSEIASQLYRLLAPHADTLSDEAIFAVVRVREWLARVAQPGDRAGVNALDELLRIAPDLPVQLGEPWTDRVLADLLAMSSEHRAAWVNLLEIMTQAKGSTPTAKWLKSVSGATAPLPREHVEKLLGDWLSLVGRPRPTIAGGRIPGRDSSIPSDSSADTLRGLAFLASRFDTPSMARALGDLAMACFKMVPGHGARCVKPGSSALWSLAQMSTPSALAQLSRLRQLVKFGTAKKMLDTSLDNLAAKLGITTEELHEIAAPDFGLSSDSTITEDAGDFTLELIADPQGAHIRVLDEAGKERKTVPDAIKKDHADTLKALKQSKDDIDKMLEAQRARIDALFIADRTWPVPAWRERYIDHPLVGVLGRRLIWRIIDDPRSSSDAGAAVLYRPDTRSFADLNNAPVTPAAHQHVKLWHPIFATSDDVRRWRDLIESASIRQPVKQAHREVYPLTDAERRTAAYSNRFAAHIIKQHAFQQLAADRAWTSKLRLAVDAEYPPPTRALPSWALRAEFWVESVGEGGADTTESGSYLYLATDQVRFYRAGAARSAVHAWGGGYTTHGLEIPENQPLPLDQIPPLVFSEIMRDVDLFIAGASIGNNADWQDGGPEGRFRDYWHSYSFGDLGASGTARREFLEKLIPRLKIAPLCSFEDKFLVVKGTLRTYKIHLGSGNILMKPNDQYLCIVPSSSFTADSGPGGVFLPFDGDRTLSIILSKAFMLAEDTRIKDASITAQINRA